MSTVTILWIRSALAILRSSALCVADAAARGLRQRMVSTMDDWRRSERERFLARAVDHVDIEHRERAWEWQNRNGSLLGG